MIPLVTEIAAAAPQENKSSDSPRNLAPSVDKFAEHLRRPKPSRAENEKSLAPKPKYQTHERGNQEPRKVAVSSEEESPKVVAKKGESETKEDAPPTGLIVEKEEGIDDEEANLAGGGAFPVCILPVQAGKPTPFVEAEIKSVDGAPDGDVSGMEEPTGPMMEVRAAVTKIAMVDPAVTNSVPVEPIAGKQEQTGEEPKPAALELETEVDSFKETQGIEVGVELEIIVKPENAAPTDALPIDTLQSEAAIVAAVPAATEKTLATIEKVEPQEESATPTASKQDKSATAVTTFAQYVFGEANSQADAGPIHEIKQGPSSNGETSVAEDEARAEENDQDEKSVQDGRVERVDPSPLLTPVDAAQSAASTLPLSLRRHLEAQATGAPAAGSSGAVISDTQHARLLQRVSRAFQAAEERGGEVQIRLSPPELGSMKLELSLSQGVLIAKLEVETQRAQSILLDSLPSLKERLAEQGIRVEKFDVNLPQRDSGGQQPQQQHSQSERQLRANVATTRQSQESATQENRTPQRPLLDASRLNVMV